jgi:tRNA1Val (adenine37-N6)-methyltransferase
MECSEDRFLGGRIVARQPLQGFRSGTDAVMLAAAVPANTGDDVLEIGSGAAIASLCVAARVAACRITGIDIAPDLVALAEENVRANGFAERFRFEEGDVFKLPNNLRKSFDHVFCNPPFHGNAGESSPNQDRARALFDRDGLQRWIVAALARVSAGGTLTLILRADRLGETFAALPQHGVTVFPLWPRRHEPAKRTILQVRQNSRAPLLLLSGLVLHDDNSCYTQEADAVLRGGASLALATPRR